MGILRMALAFLRAFFASRAALAAENVMLRQQLIVLQRQGLVQRDHQRVLTQDHGDRLGRVAGRLLLERPHRLRDLLRHGWPGLAHQYAPISGCPLLRADARVPLHFEQKKADTAEHPRVLNRVGLLVNGLPGTAGLPSSSHPTRSRLMLRSIIMIAERAHETS